MLIKTPDSWITEEYATTPVRLESVLVGIDHDGVSLADPIEGTSRLSVQVAGESEVAAIGSIHVQAEVVPLAQGENLDKGIDSPGGSRSEGRHDRSDPALGDRPFQRPDIHASMGVNRDPPERDPQDRRQTRMRIMRLSRGGDGLPGAEFAGHPECLEVGHRPPSAQVSQVCVPAKHPRDSGHRLFLHRRAGSTAIQRVIVGVEPQRQRVGQPGDRMGRFEHLPHVQRVMVRVVVPHPLSRRQQRIAERTAVESQRCIGKIAEPLLERAEGLTEQFDTLVIQCHAPGLQL